MARITVSAILARKYYPNQTLMELEPSRPLSEFTFADLSSYVNRQFGLLAHAMHGYRGQKFEKQYRNHVVVGRVDTIKKENGRRKIVEAKFAFYTSGIELRYGLDQLDLYGWITGITQGELRILWVNRAYYQVVPHKNNFDNAVALVDWYIKELGIY